MIEFLNQLAVLPMGNEDQGFEFMEKKVAVIAYRKSVYQEVLDEPVIQHHLTSMVQGTLKIFYCKIK